MLSKLIDYTLLKPDCTENAVVALCQTAIKHQFFAVCIPSYYVKAAVGLVCSSGVRVCTVVGFPLGMQSAVVKLHEAELALAHGVHEIDMMMNLSAFKSGKYDVVRGELSQMRAICEGVVLKVIVESGALNDDEIKAVVTIASEVGVDFVKTSTGFFNPAAELEKVTLLRNLLPASIEVKASGGIRTAEQALQFIRAGATRIGTSALFV